MKKMILPLFLVFALQLSYAQNITLIMDSLPEPLQVYHLGEVVVSESSDRETLSKKNMEKANALEVGKAMNSMPSIHLAASGARNESTVYLRGFDLRSIPVFVDGIPVYVSYDGYVDLARFSTADLSKIEVSKGYSSVLYGANTIGGAINLVGYKPEKKMEILLNTGFSSGNGQKYAATLGSKWGKIYFSAHASLLKQDFVPLSQHFEPGLVETDRELDNSYRNDQKVSIKLGFNPNPKHEYTLNYVYQQGEKGNPVYLGSDESIRLRYWQWPHWDKQSLYFIGKTDFTEKTYLKTRLFYDNFINQLKSFDDSSYTTQNMRYAFTSNYDDYSFGGSMEAGTSLSDDQLLKFAAHYKSDIHRENNEGEPVRTFSDYTLSFGVENEWKLSDRMKFIPGLSYNFRKSISAEDYNAQTEVITEFPENQNGAVNLQIAYYYTITDFLKISYTTAHKTRFATMKDRYSYRLGLAIPNPDLASESALNQELTMQLDIFDFLSIQPAIFYSKLRNTIQMVDNVEPGISQMQNTGEAQFYGSDLSVYLKPSGKFNAAVHYTFIKRKNISSPEILFTDVPEHKVIGLLDYRPFSVFNISISSEYSAERYSTSYGTVNHAFVLFHAQMAYDLGQYLRFEAGVNNLLDADYSLTEGYPAAGRNFYVSARFKLSK